MTDFDWALLERTEAGRIALRRFLVCMICGPTVYALAFTVNAEIAMFFFDTNPIRPWHEYVVMMPLFGLIGFMWMWIANLPAFIVLGLWLAAQRFLRLNHWVAAIAFIPVITFIDSRLYGQWDMMGPDPTPPRLVFGSMLLWEFPFRGILLTFVCATVAVVVCCLLLSRNRAADREQTMVVDAEQG